MIKRFLKNFEYILFILVTLLGIYGLLILYSASSYTALNTFGDDKYFVIRQSIFLGIAILVLLISSYLPKKMIYNFSFTIYILSITLVILTFFIGIASHGSYRWITIKGVTFQPSELMKYGLILYMSVSCREYLLDKVSMEEKSKERSIMRIMAIGIVPSLIIAISNLSTSVICIIITILYIFVISEKKMVFISLLAIILSFFIFKYPIALIIEKIGLLKPYQTERIMAWADPTHFEDTAYQTLQSLYAIGSGGIWGRGIGESLQKLVLPEAHNDMIFAIIVEELGLIGSIFFISIYIVIIYRIYYIGYRNDDIFAKLVAYGVGTHIFVQVILNISVCLNLIPNTGITLPFISYGGSSLVILALEIGTVIALNKKT